MLYAADENYSVDGKDQDTIINEIADQYGKGLSCTLQLPNGDEAYFDEDAATIASEYLVEQKTAAGEGEEVANIEGIQKLVITKLRLPQMVSRQLQSISLG